MLDQLRRHASSWVIKGTLSLIVVSFILFFGYTEFSSSILDQQRYIAFVGETGVPRRRFDITYEGSLDRMREGLKEEMPDKMTDFLRQNVLDQLIMRELLVQFAQELGMAVSDEEIAREIQTDKILFPDGNIDLAAYEEKFLPYYQQRYGEHYETSVKRQLLIEKVLELLPSLFGPWEEEWKNPLLTSENLLSLWIDDYREKVKVEVFR